MLRRFLGPGQSLIQRYTLLLEQEESCVDLQRKPYYNAGESEPN